MIAQLFLGAAFLATASAGIATSYAVGGVGLHRLDDGLGLGGGLRLRGGDDGLGLGDGLGLRHGGIVGLGGGAIIGGHERVVDIHTPARYEFKYGVGDPKTGDRKEQSESRVNDVVKGQYSLVEPDGTIRVVKYTADDHNGFNAVVSRIGHAAHPQVHVVRTGLALGGIGLDHGY